MLELSFDVMQSCAIAAAVVMVGRAIVRRVKFFQTYCIPGVIVCGLLISLTLGLLRSGGILAVNWNVGVLKEWFMDIFFTGVGLTASWKLIKKGGAKLCGGIAITIIGLIFAQNLLGIVLAVPLGLHPLHGIGLGSLSLMGGVGTSGAIAPLYEELGAENAVVMSVMCATFGMIFASLVGGPVARALIKKHNLSGNRDEVDASTLKYNAVYPLNAKSLMGSVALIIISAGLGTIYGAIATYVGGTIENIMFRVSDAIMMIPGMLLVISLVSILGVSTPNLIVAMSIGGIPYSARLARSTILPIRNSDYVEAARTIGASDARILFTHILPNGISPLIVSVSMRIGTNIISVAAYSFLGLGVPLPIPEWGSMLSEARSYMSVRPDLIFYPGITILLFTLAFNLLGDGLRDALDPKLKR